jgi:hypothetical protein
MTTKATLLNTVLGSLKLYHLEFDGVDNEAREVIAPELRRNFSECFGISPNTQQRSQQRERMFEEFASILEEVA